MPGDRTFYLADAPARLYHPAAYYVAKVRALVMHAPAS